MSAHHDDRERRQAFMQTFQELHPVYARKPDVEQHERGLHGIEFQPEGLGIRKGESLVPLVLQDAGYCGSDGSFVVYYADRVHIRLCTDFTEIWNEHRVRHGGGFVKNMLCGKDGVVCRSWAWI
jgi:hypothetical protein